MMKLRLFTLRNSEGPLSGTYFSSKPEAKRHRDELNTGTSKGYVVTPGPDHYKANRTK